MKDFVYITDGTYNQPQLVRMEGLFLKVLAFNMTVPTAYQFLRLFITIHGVCSKTTHLALVSTLHHHQGSSACRVNWKGIVSC